MLGRQRGGELGDAFDDGAQRFGVVGIRGGPGGGLQARIGFEGAGHLGDHRGLAHDREVVVGKRARPREQEIGDLGVVVAEERVARARERRPHRATQRREVGCGAGHQRAHDAEARREVGVAGLAHAVEEADQGAQSRDAQAAVRDGATLGARFAREERGLDRAERAGELLARGIVLGRERDHGGEHVVGEELAIDLAQEAHRVAAIDGVVVGGALEPVRGFADLLDRGACFAQRGGDVAGVERGSRGGDRLAEPRALVGRRRAELDLEGVEQGPATVVARRLARLLAGPRAREARGAREEGCALFAAQLGERFRAVEGRALRELVREVVGDSGCGDREAREPEDRTARDARILGRALDDDRRPAPRGASALEGGGGRRGAAAQLRRRRARPELAIDRSGEIEIDVGEEAARDRGEPPDERLAVAEQSLDRRANPGAHHYGDAAAIAGIVPAQRFASPVREDARGEAARGQGAHRGAFDPARGEDGLRAQAERELADRADGAGQRRGQHDLGARAQAVARDELGRRASERYQQAHEALAIGVAQAQQHAAAELASLRPRGKRLRELEQRDRARRGRHPVEVCEQAVAERRANREQERVGRDAFERRGLALGDLREGGEPLARDTLALVGIRERVQARECREVRARALETHGPSYRVSRVADPTA